MHNRHAWVDRTGDGSKREIRVIKTGGSWRFQSKTAGDERWTYYDLPPIRDLKEFREVLYRKYQRRRASYEDVLWADQQLSRRRDETDPCEEA